MKILSYLMINMLFSFPIILMFTMLTLYFNNTLKIPLKQITFLIIYSILMSLYIYINTKNYFYPMMILISYTSGVMILFSYFISMMNIVLTPSKNLMSMILIFSFFTLMTTILNKYPFYSSSLKLQKIFNLYFNSNMFLIILLILLLLSMLYLTMKICFIKKKSLRHI